MRGSLGKMAKVGPYLIALAAILWGLDGILRRSLFSLPPIVIVFYEHLIGALILAPFFLKKLRNAKFTNKEWLALLGVSLLSGVLGTLWFTTALVKVNFISFSVVFLIQKLQPIFAIGAAAMLLKEKINKHYVKWAVLAFTAAYFVTFQNGVVNFKTGEGTVVAALFALGAAFAWGSSTAFSRFTLFRHSNTLITGARFWMTTVLALIFVFSLGAGAELNAPTGNQFLRLVVIAFTTGMVALWIYYKGLKHTQAKVSTILELMFPLVAVAIDIFLYDNFLAPSQYLAALVLVFAIYKVARMNKGFDTRYEVLVKTGVGRGKRIGFPTLNFEVPENFEHAHGIYGGWIYIGEEKHKAVFHFGPIPTFHEAGESLEAYILDAEIKSGVDRVAFRFVQRLRDVEGFSSVEGLAKAISEDVDRAKRILR